MSETIAAPDAEGRLAELIERVARGEEIVITSDGVAVAMIVPPPAVTLAELRSEIAARGGPLPLSAVLAWRDDRRP
jgi:prevent-host-death family protein